MRVASRKAAGRKSAQRRKVPRTYRLTPAKIAAAQRALGTKSATETIEAALDLVLFKRELVDGTAAMLGIDITPPEPTR